MHWITRHAVQLTSSNTDPSFRSNLHPVDWLARSGHSYPWYRYSEECFQLWGTRRRTESDVDGILPTAGSGHATHTRKWPTTMHWGQYEPLWPTILVSGCLLWRRLHSLWRRHLGWSPGNVQTPHSNMHVHSGAQRWHASVPWNNCSCDLEFEVFLDAEFLPPSALIRVYCGIRVERLLDVNTNAILSYHFESTGQTGCCLWEGHAWMWWLHHRLWHCSHGSSLLECPREWTLQGIVVLKPFHGCSAATGCQARLFSVVSLCLICIYGICPTLWTCG